MSEYQYYEFLAIDRPLTSKQIDEVRRWSTRAEITSTSFVNEYHFGDFHGNPELLVSKYFDVMVYFANWGTHRLLMNVPVENVKGLKRYESDILTVHKKHDRVLVDFDSNTDDYDDSWDIDSRGLMASLAPVRAEIAGGDLRSLFLGWLSGLYVEEEENDDAVPPIPEGLNHLTRAQKRLADYLRVDEDLLAAAAERSAPSRPPTVSLEGWIAGLPAEQKNSFIAAVISESDPGAVAVMRCRYKLESAAPKGEAESGGLTVGQLLTEAREIQRDRKAHAGAKKKRDAERREAEAAEERERRIEELMLDEKPMWKSVESIVVNKQATEYERAVKQLADLREVAVRRGALEDFSKRVRQLREAHKGKRKFVTALDAAKIL